jgi:hypothetical protein
MNGSNADILVPEMLEQLQLTISALRQDGCAEGLHDFLHGNGLAGKLIFGRTEDGQSEVLQYV